MTRDKKLRMINMEELVFKNCRTGIFTDNKKAYYKNNEVCWLSSISPRFFLAYTDKDLVLFELKDDEVTKRTYDNFTRNIDGVFPLVTARMVIEKLCAIEPIVQTCKGDSSWWVKDAPKYVCEVFNDLFIYHNIFMIGQSNAIWLLVKDKIIKVKGMMTSRYDISFSKCICYDTATKLLYNVDGELIRSIEPNERLIIPPIYGVDHTKIKDKDGNTPIKFSLPIGLIVQYQDSVLSFRTVSDEEICKKELSLNEVLSILGWNKAEFKKWKALPWKDKREKMTDYVLNSLRVAVFSKMDKANNEVFEYIRINGQINIRSNGDILV